MPLGRLRARRGIDGRVRSLRKTPGERQLPDEKLAPPESPGPRVSARTAAELRDTLLQDLIALDIIARTLKTHVQDDHQSAYLADQISEILNKDIEGIRSALPESSGRRPARMSRGKQSPAPWSTGRRKPQL